MSDTPKLKDYFEAELAALLADKLQPLVPTFERERFVQAVAAQVPPLALKARVSVIAAELKHQLMPDNDYPQALNILLQILGPENPNETGMFTEGYWLMPVAEFIRAYGQNHYEPSMAAIYQLTKRHTGEFAIRPYIVQQPERSLALLHTWATDESFHVRRLASEGIRPRLPWAQKLDMFIADPRPVIAVLTRLKADESRFVQKSVANTMNDILKDNETIAMDTLRAWAATDNPHTRWIIKHALRRKRKESDPAALAILNWQQLRYMGHV